MASREKGDSEIDRVDGDSSPIADLDLRLESTADQVAAAVREAILDGRLPQGTYLRETPLSRQFGVSRNTIREATHILIGQRLVTKQMHRGAFVSKLDPDDIRDLYRLRRIIELPALPMVAAQELDDAVAHLWQAIENESRAAMVAADLEFHRQVVAAMGSERLTGLFGSLEGEMRLCMSLIGGTFPEPDQFAREHAAIRDALAADETARAGELLATHLTDAERSLVAALRRRGQRDATLADATSPSRTRSSQGPTSPS
jgi:DNA-binding GntR family transcriptional regulator